MKATLAAGLFLFAMLFVAVTVIESPQARAQAQRYFSAAEIDTGVQYAFGRRLIYWLSEGLKLSVLAIAVFAGWGVALRNLSLRWMGGRWLPAVILVGLVVFIVEELIRFPFSLARLEYTRAWNMTEQPVLDWLGDYAKGTAVSLAAGGIPFVGLYLLLRWMPRWWWLPATAGVAVLAICFALMLPVIIAPLFNTFTPLSQTKWAHLEKSVRTLARQADVPVQEVLVVDASRQSAHSNAYFTGFGGTRRIVLYDTLLKKHPADEVESVVAHEIGHWREQHIVKGIVLGSLAAMVGFYLLSRILRGAVGRRPCELTSPSDPAGWPLILLLAALAGWATMPLGNAVSRHFEREADYAALELAGQPKAFIEAEKRLARDNLSNVTPNPFSVWLLATHPPVLERIRMAEDWPSR